MKVFLNNQKINKELFTLNSGLNFGRFFDKNNTIFEIRFKKDDFLDLIEQEYNAIKEEIRNDDLLNNETSEFRATNYCTLENLLKYSNQFEAIVKSYLDRELYLKLFPPTKQNKFVINSTDSVQYIGDEVILNGRVIELKTK